MQVLAVILARTGSKGLPDKCIRPLLGKAVIEYTFDHALHAKRVNAVVLTTDSQPAKAFAQSRGIHVVDRPTELAHDTATVDAAARHAVAEIETRLGRRFDAIVLLYGNIPVRADGVIDRALERLEQTGADSVRTVAPVSKQHPDWVHRLEGDRMRQFRANSIYRRQDLEPIYYHDGAVAAVTRDALFAAPRFEGDHQGFLGEDRRAIVQQPEDAVDIDGPVDLAMAEAVLRMRSVDGDVTSAHMIAGRRPGIRIGRRVVGPRCAPFVIAEAGVNHNGDIDEALRLVDASAAAGADAVKFQWFNADALTTADARQADYQQRSAQADSQREMLRRLQLGCDAFGKLGARCDDRGILFLATPFSVADLQSLIELRPPAIKIASTDINNVPLLRAAVTTGLPLLISTGASEAIEIAQCIRLITDAHAADRTVLLHCVSSYPTEPDDANLSAIGTLRMRFGMHVGYSDHTTSTQTGALAVACGAVLLEKHFTMDRSADGPDHAISLEPDQLREYVQLARTAFAALGDGELGVADCERDVRAIARKSIVAARDIAPGEPITSDAIALKRPGGGLEPGEFDKLVGRCATVPIHADARLSWEMVR